MSTADRTPVDVGTRIQSLLRRRGVGASKAAREMQIPVSSFNCWVGRGATVPRDPQVLKKIADYFGISVDYLLTGEEFRAKDEPKSHSFQRYEILVRVIDDS